MSDRQLRQKVRKFLRCREGQDLSARVQELSVRPEQLFLPQAQDPVIMDVPLDQVRFASHVSDDVIASMSASYQSKDVQLHQWCLDHKIAGKWRFRASVIVSAVFIHLYSAKYFDAVVSRSGNLFPLCMALKKIFVILAPVSLHAWMTCNFPWLLCVFARSFSLARGSNRCLSTGLVRT